MFKFLVPDKQLTATSKIESKFNLSKRQHGLLKREPLLHAAILKRNARNCRQYCTFLSYKSCSYPVFASLVRRYSTKDKPSETCTPCCGSSLPPPSNTPPKCIQYVTGYYYYPYGYWFCGPYHVSTNCNATCPPSIPKFCACLCPTCAAMNANSAKEREIPTETKSKSAFSELFPFHSNTSQRSASDVFQPFNHSLNCQCSFCLKESQDKTNVVPKLLVRRQLPTQQQRDNPTVEKNSFNYTTVPKYKNPYPNLENIAKDLY